MAKWNFAAMRQAGRWGAAIGGVGGHLWRGMYRA